MPYYDNRERYDAANANAHNVNAMGGASDLSGANSQWNAMDHIDEMNAGIAQYANHRGSHGGNEEGVSAQQATRNPYNYSGYDPYGLNHQQQQQQGVNNGSWGTNNNGSRGNESSLRELDYCDLLLRGLDNTTAQAQAQSQQPPAMSHQQMLQNQLMWNQAQQQQQQQQQGMWGHTGNNVQGGQSKSTMSNLDYFMNSMQQHPYSTTVASTAPNKSTSTQSSYLKSIKSSSNTKSTPHTATSTPSSYLPHSNSSKPEKSIDPQLETLSLSIPSVSLTSLSGNEVIMHIRSKTDDVITRFLPCVDFLVNCQQELRQGLAIATQRKYTNGRSRSSVNMTPHQFFVRFVAPLPGKFERKCDYLMAREHLLAAKVQLDHLVKDAQQAIPQGCEHVKNTFLGGMRENESWGLRKWLSKHGGAGSICNDLEEVLRTVKGLKREEKTTIKLAEQLRPIASQAHDRLKKDVPQAYQEQSSAHPYLPFFHRLEACLKQMATYDPEDDDVICLDSDDDEVEEVKVESKKVAEPPKSSHAVKKRILQKREREEDHCSSAAPPYKRGKSLENITPQPRIEKGTPNGGNEPEVICIDDSSDEEEDNYEQSSQLLKLEGGLDSPSPTEPGDTIEGKGWRCQHCTCLNAPNVLKCTMCNDEDSSGGNETDELARFLGGGFMDDSNHASE